VSCASSSEARLSGFSPDVFECYANCISSKFRSVLNNVICGNFHFAKLNNMNELLLVIIFVGILMASQFLSKTAKAPGARYLKIFFAVALLLLVWVFDQDGHDGPKLVLSALSLGVVFREFLLLRKAQVNS
jgi:hypothetical protein